MFNKQRMTDKRLEGHAQEEAQEVTRREEKRKPDMH